MRRAAARNLPTALTAKPVRGPTRKFDKTFAWPQTPEAGLREQARSLLAESLDKALPRLLAR